MNRTLKNVLLVGLTLVVPGAGLAWLIKIAKAILTKILSGMLNIGSTR